MSEQMIPEDDKMSKFDKKMLKDMENFSKNDILKIPFPMDGLIEKEEGETK